jgi:N-acetylglucosamine kinase-like BadF-type ATPase
MYLGVDGGGTKTAFLLLDPTGRVLARHQEASTYYIQVGIEGVRRAINDGVKAIFARASRPAGDLRFAFFGLPAHGEDRENTAILDQLPAEVLPLDRYLCGNDMVCGWAGSLSCQDGISVVAGTGSICYGENHTRTARCGGWGELFSDEGSAYWIAREGLTLFSRMSDNRQAKGPLHEIFVKRLGLADDIDLAGKVYNEWSQQRNKIAELSQLVREAAEQGDAAAREVFVRAGAELAALVDATRRTLQFPTSQRVPVSYSGGVFNSGSLLLDPFISSLKAMYANYSVQQPRFSPDIGAALYAARRCGAPLPTAALQRLEDEGVSARNSG